MINSVFLLVAALLVFAFGYRFFAKFLAIWVFRLNGDYSTPTPTPADSGQDVTHNRHILLGQHVGSLAAAATIAGTTLAVFWGWIPAFLWVVIGSTVGAGTYGIGSLWLAGRHCGKTPDGPARSLAGRRAGVPIVALLAALSVLVNAVIALAIAEVLVTYPASAIPFCLLGIVALALGAFLRRRANSKILPATLIALTTVFMVLWLFRSIPLGLVGVLQLQTTANSVVSLDARVAWVAAVFALAWYAAREPLWKLARPYSFLSAAILGVTMLIMFAAVVIAHPMLVAPAFHAPKDAPGTLPWLFITLTSGAIGGCYALIAGSFTTHRLERETDTRYIGYGSAIANGVIALSAILIGSTTPANQEAWLHVYSSWDNASHLGLLLRIYIDGFADFAHAVGVNLAFAKSLAALMIMCLGTMTIISGIRAQRHMLKELAQSYAVSWIDTPRILGMTVTVTAVLAAQASRGGTLWYWPLFGLTNQMVAVAVLAVMLLALARQRRPLTLVLVPLLFVLAVSSWALVLQLIAWQAGRHWALFGAGLALTFMVTWALWEISAALRKPEPSSRS